MSSQSQEKSRIAHMQLVCARLQTGLRATVFVRARRLCATDFYRILCTKCTGFLT